MGPDLRPARPNGRKTEFVIVAPLLLITPGDRVELRRAASKRSSLEPPAEGARTESVLERKNARGVSAEFIRYLDTEFVPSALAAGMTCAIFVEGATVLYPFPIGPISSRLLFALVLAIPPFLWLLELGLQRAAERRASALLSTEPSAENARAIGRQQLVLAESVLEREAPRGVVARCLDYLNSERGWIAGVILTIVLCEVSMFAIVRLLIAPTVLMEVGFVSSIALVSAITTFVTTLSCS